MHRPLHEVNQQAPLFRGFASVKVRDRCYRSVYPAEEPRGSGDFAVYNRG